ncbi:MAG: DNA topoisomerase I, partial [Nitrososphaeraceae archaeon]
YKLVICEKPLAAKRISQVLGSKKMIKREAAPGVVIFEIITNNDQRFIVCSALGHLYNLFPIEKNRKKYPVYEVRWSPRHSATVREKRRVMQTLKLIANISKGASGFIHACDYDLEGELIGYNILQYACDNKYEVSKRAKFSSLTDSEISQSFNNLQETNIRIADAGKARHLIDFIFGINLSRALVNCLNVSNKNNRYHNLTIGRVQGPTLGFIVNREIKIRNYIPDPIWYVTGKFEKGGSFFKANLISVVHKSSEIEKILTSCQNETALINEIVRRKKKINPPTPFNISNLQKEAYRIFKISPVITLSIVESLYLAALISYPRTSSQKLPPSIGYKQILEQLCINYVTKYENIIKDLLRRKFLVPYQGDEEDPAHPAIYPTGVKQKKLSILQQRILDLIIKRFLSTFGNIAVIKYSEVSVNVNGYQFIAKGNKILNDGWIPIYEPYFSINDSNLPDLTIGERIKVNEVTAMEDFTRPPARYNEASLLDKMESEGIGTKSTRAGITNLLIKRKYITQDKIGIEPTELGFTIFNTMKKFVSEIVSTKLTNFLESSIKGIEKGELNMNDVRKYLEKSLESPLNKIKTNEWTIGDEIKNVLTNSESGMRIGKCPKCQFGEMILIKSSKSNKRFIVCSQYRVTGCNAIASVPQIGFIKKSNTICSCGWPILRIVFARKKLWRICVNRACPENTYKKNASHHDSESNTSI